MRGTRRTFVLCVAYGAAACGEVKVPGTDAAPMPDAYEEPDATPGPDAAPEPCRVAYTVLTGGIAHDVWTALVDGSGAVNASSDSADDFGPRFARTGRLLFLTTRGSREVWTSGPRGEDARRVAPAQFAAWSRDGSRMAIGRADGLYMSTVDGQIETKLSDRAPAGDMEFSPDDKTILFHGFDGEIYTVPSAGGTTTNLTRTSGFHEQSATYSPDGSRIAYGRGSDTVRPDIWTMEASGANPANLTATEPTADYRPLWGADGSIYFASDREGTGKIFRLPATGGVAVRVTDNRDTGLDAGDVPVDVSADGLLLFARSGETVGTIRGDGSDLHLFPVVNASAGALSCGVSL